MIKRKRIPAIGDEVRVRTRRQPGWSAKEWKPYAGHRGKVIDKVIDSVDDQVDWLYVRLSGGDMDGQRRWFWPSELLQMGETDDED